MLSRTCQGPDYAAAAAATYPQAYRDGQRKPVGNRDQGSSMPLRLLRPLLDPADRNQEVNISWTLLVEVDGVLGGQEHVARIRKTSGGSGYCSYAVACPAAFWPLAGKALVAWRFIRPRTLVLAVKTATAAAARHAPHVIARSGTFSEDEEDEEEEGGEGGEKEEEKDEDEEEEDEAWQPVIPPSLLAYSHPQGPAPQRVSAPRTASKRQASRFQRGEREDEASMPAKTPPGMQVGRWVGGGAAGACRWGGVCVGGGAAGACKCCPHCPEN